MSEIVYDARPELREPLRFLRGAVSDLRRSGPVAWQLFVRNVRVKYRRAWLGYVWLLLPTIGMAVVWTYVQSRRIVDIAPTGVPYPVYVLTGMMLWQVFVDALNAPLQQLASGRQFITRSLVPHEALILAGMLEVFLNCGVRLLVVAMVLIAFAIPVTTTVLLAPIGIAALALFGLTLGLLAAPIGLLYDDVGRSIALGTGFWFFLTPVLYTMPRGGALRWNPVTPLLDTTRAWLTSGSGTSGFLLVTTVTVVALIATWLFHRLARPHVVARLG